MNFIMINPGTEGRQGATLANAQVVADHICTNLSIPQGCLTRLPASDTQSGWFGFVLKLGSDVAIEVDIPGDDPAQVVAGKPFVSRRLYVDGSSWLYDYALAAIARRMRGEQ